jgi:hypothetical protein
MSVEPNMFKDEMESYIISVNKRATLALVTVQL